MHLKVLVALGMLCLLGCSSVDKTWRFRFPPDDAVSYAAPDGHTWVLYDVTKSADGRYTVTFTPVRVDKGQWSEQLIFAMSAEDLSAETTRQRLKQLSDAYDPQLTFSSQDVADGVLTTTHSPTSGETGIMKAVRVGPWFYTVSYSQRLGTQGDARLKVWQAIVKEWPPASLVPAGGGSAAPVGSPAAPAPR